ncbi:hypothetical protein OK016_19645 [Vibrio chagasii]|nr:hypothetical protein [Vibrio chagasii]
MVRYLVSHAPKIIGILLFTRAISAAGGIAVFTYLVSMQTLVGLIGTNSAIEAHW